MESAALASFDPSDPTVIILEDDGTHTYCQVKEDGEWLLVSIPVLQRGANALVGRTLFSMERQPIGVIVALARQGTRCELWQARPYTKMSDGRP